MSSGKNCTTASAMSCQGKRAGAKRRTHSKSRTGCRNCKIRRVKCDENKPQCKKCENYSILCSYGSSGPDLQVHAGTLHSWNCADDKQQHQPENGATMSSLSSAIVGPDGTTSFTLDGECLDLLHRFGTRTILTIGNAGEMRACQDEIVHTAYSCPFLMHAILSITAMHDRSQGPRPGGRLTATETHHWSQCAALLNKKLSEPVIPEQRDALWATASFLGIIAFSAIEASTPEEAWPLRPSEPSDLEWLRMSEGKLAVWNITNPLRPGSMFHRMSGKYAEIFAPPPTCGIDGIPPALMRLCSLDALSTAENNPYFAAAHSLGKLQNMYIEELAPSRFFNLIANMQSRFKTLLQVKDPIALLLLAIWYDKISGSTWWTKQRATVERDSICLYLQSYHPGNTLVQEFLSGGQLLRSNYDVGG